MSIDKTIAEFVADRALPAVGPEDTVARAVEVMKTNRCDAVVVVEKVSKSNGEDAGGGTGALVGIFTQRDFLNRVAAAGLEVGATAMSLVMTKAPETLAPTDGISYAINRMAERGFRNIPIVFGDGEVHSVLSVRDVVSHLSDLFAELAPERGGWEEWTDTGGSA